jgi:hypothetical protein
MEARMRDLLPSIVGHVPGASRPCAGRARAPGPVGGDSPAVGRRLSVTLRRAAGSTVALALEDYKPFAEEDNSGGEGKAVAWVKTLAEMARNKDRASRLQV